MASCGHGMKLVKRINKLERFDISLTTSEFRVTWFAAFYRLEEIVATSLRTRDGLTNEVGTAVDQAECSGWVGGGVCGVMKERNIITQVSNGIKSLSNLYPELQQGSTHAHFSFLCFV